MPLTCVSAQALQTDMWEGSRVGPAHVAPVATLETERNRFIPAQPMPESLTHAFSSAYSFSASEGQPVLYGLRDGSRQL